MFRSSCIALALANADLAPAAHASAPSFDTSAIETITGLKGKYNKAEDVFKVSKPRDDIKGEVDRWIFPPFMGTTSWVAFMPMGNSAMVMGYTVLFEDEVNPAMSAGLEAGLECTSAAGEMRAASRRTVYLRVSRDLDDRCASNDLESPIAPIDRAECAQRLLRRKLDA